MKNFQRYRKKQKKKFHDKTIKKTSGRYWAMVERHRLTQFFSAPTAYRMLMQFDNSWVEKYDLSSLKYIMVAGENCNEAAWKWLYEVVGQKRCKVVDCWWQTETGRLSAVFFYKDFT